MIESIQRFVRSARSNKFLTRAIPFAAFVVGGSVFLKQFSTLRYEFRHGKRLSPEEAAAYGIEVKDIKNAQKEILQDIQKEEPDDWHNIRGPRPWEDSKTIQDLQRQDIPENRHIVVVSLFKTNIVQNCLKDC